MLLESAVLVHPFVIGELACGHLQNRREILALLWTGDRRLADIAAGLGLAY